MLQILLSFIFSYCFVCNSKKTCEKKESWVPFKNLYTPDRCLMFAKKKLFFSRRMKYESRRISICNSLDNKDQWHDHGWQIFQKWCILFENTDRYLLLFDVLLMSCLPSFFLKNFLVCYCFCFLQSETR